MIRDSKIEYEAWCEVATRRFWCAYMSFVGGYRRCPIAISPNLSNLQPTVHEITVGIERMHDERARVDMLAVRLPSPVSWFPSVLFPDVTDGAAVAVGDPTYRRWLDFEVSSWAESFVHHRDDSSLATGCGLNGK